MPNYYDQFGEAAGAAMAHNAAMAARHAAARAETEAAPVADAPVDRAAVLREASAALRRKAIHDGEDFCRGIEFAADYLDGMADEARQPKEAGR